MSARRRASSEKLGQNQLAQMRDFSSDRRVHRVEESDGTLQGEPFPA